VPSLPTNAAEVPDAIDTGGGGSPSPVPYVNRDLSWLQFNRRVLHEAVDPRTPLLEQVRFFGIFTSNLDEFFMKRVGALNQLVDSAPTAATRDGMMPADQLTAVRAEVLDLLDEQSACFRTRIRPALRENGIELLEWSELTANERAEAEQYFRSHVFPILTPLAVDPGHPFPFISNLSVSLAVILQHPERAENLFARIKVPEMLPRWVRLRSSRRGDDTYRFYSIYDLLRNNLDDLFLNMKVIDVSLFRLTRSVEPELEDEDEPEDLRAAVQEELRARRFAAVVRLEHDSDLNPQVRSFLLEELALRPDELYEVPMGLAHQDLQAIVDLKIPRLSYAPWTPCVPALLSDSDVDFFGAIRNGDLLVHHPYESFQHSVERFVSAAAADPKVLAIKMTLYRTSDDSSFVRTLIRAAEARKQVVCLVELKARFDEERNIVLTRALEKAGVHVVYGLVGLKTHSKTTLVVRQESEGLRCYAHIGTGNYHPGTSRLYTDLGLFTCDPDITGDLVELFHHLTGRSIKTDYRKLLVAPENMRPHFLELIDREIGHARAGRPARIIAKCNSLEDRKIIAKLYEASSAGVEIDLIVRGLCCIRPQVPGLSDRVRVISIIGRFLEHSRIFYFQDGRKDPLQGRFFIGSTDWMYRNLLARVEVVVPIETPALRQRLWDLLQIMLADRRQAWGMGADGFYVQRTPRSSDEPGTHQILMDLTRQQCGTVAP
jgi:polyphosphate kinase